MLPLLLALSITSSEFVKDESYVPQLNDEVWLSYKDDTTVWAARDKTSYLTYHWMRLNGEAIEAESYKRSHDSIVELPALTKVTYLGQLSLKDPNINKLSTPATLIRTKDGDLLYTYSIFISRFREVPIATWRHPVLLQTRIRTLLRSANNLERMHKTKGAAEHYNQVLKLSADDSAEHKTACERLKALGKQPAEGR
jgi:hypothetical protein